MDRSYLFVPADRPDRFGKARASGAHVVVVDLEDAVAPAQKAAARDGLRAWLDGADAAPVLVRINPPGTPWHADDLALAGHAGLGGVMLPKAERGADVRAVAARLRPEQALVALVETVAGLFAVAEIASTPGVTRLAFGHLDFMVDSGVRGDGAELDPVRLQLVLASRLASLPAPIDGVTAVLGQPDALQRDLERAGRLGFGAKLCIHPEQVGAVNAAFLPSATDAAWARRVIAALEAGPAGAVAVDGKLVDKPVERQARAILAALPPPRSP